jgi:hypothetical protein
VFKAVTSKFDAGLWLSISTCYCTGVTGWWNLHNLAHGALLAALHVISHGASGQLGVARGDGLDDLTMTLHRRWHGTGMSQVQTAIQRQLLDEFAVDGQ